MFKCGYCDYTSKKNSCFILHTKEVHDVDNAFANTSGDGYTIESQNALHQTLLFLESNLK